MQTTLSRTMQTPRITGSLRALDRDDQRRVLAIVDGLLSVTQQEWCSGLDAKAGQNLKVTQ